MSKDRMNFGPTLYLASLSFQQPFPSRAKSISRSIMTIHFLAAQKSHPLLPFLSPVPSVISSQWFLLFLPLSVDLYWNNLLEYSLAALSHNDVSPTFHYFFLLPPVNGRVICPIVHFIGQQKAMLILTLSGMALLPFLFIDLLLSRD